MMSCDTNVLFAAIDSHSAYHEAAVAYLNDVMSSEDFGICELVLVELYGLLRNPAVLSHPLDAAEAVHVIQAFRSHPRWLILDYPGPESKIMDSLWALVGRGSFAYRKIYDARLALTLRHHGVTEWATRNLKDFQGFGFKKVWNPLSAS